MHELALFEIYSKNLILMCFKMNRPSSSNSQSPQVRLELTTYRLTVERAADCATKAQMTSDLSLELEGQGLHCQHY